MTKPDYWQIIKIEHKDSQPVYKVFATFTGGYLDGDSWKLNSGIVKVEEHDDHYDFFGYSGSCYRCKKGANGTVSYTQAVLDNFINLAKDQKAELTVLDPETDWTKIEY